MSTKKLSKRSLNYLAIIGNTEFGAYRGIIPWSTERILRDQKLVTKMGEDRGIPILRITDAGRSALAPPSPEPPRLTTNWQGEDGEVMWSGKPTYGELRDALQEITNACKDAPGLPIGILAATHHAERLLARCQQGR